MHYLIHKWMPEELAWRVVYYTPNFDDMHRMMAEYPESQGYVHSIDLKWLKSHEIVSKVVEAKLQQKAEENKRAEAIKARIEAFKTNVTSKGT